MEIRHIKIAVGIIRYDILSSKLLPFQVLIIINNKTMTFSSIHLRKECIKGNFKNKIAFLLNQHRSPKQWKLKILK